MCGIPTWIIQLCIPPFWLVVWYLVMAFMEYIIHRYTMHKRQNWLPKWIWKHHAVDHHRDDRNDLNIDLPFYIHLVVGSPILFLSYYYFGIISMSCLLAIFYYHSYVWTHMHRAIHGIKDHWIGNTKYYERAKKHHLDHHKRPAKNFGVVFLWTDYVFGTKYE